jgi:hypothetical protein
MLNIQTINNTTTITFTGKLQRVPAAKYFQKTLNLTLLQALKYVQELRESGYVIIVL